MRRSSIKYRKATKSVLFNAHSNDLMTSESPRLYVNKYTTALEIKSTCRCHTFFLRFFLLRCKRLREIRYDSRRISKFKEATHLIRTQASLTSVYISCENFEQLFVLMKGIRYVRTLTYSNIVIHLQSMMTLPYYMMISLISKIITYTKRMGFESEVTNTLTIKFPPDVRVEDSKLDISSFELLGTLLETASTTMKLAISFTIPNYSFLEKVKRVLEYKLNLHKLSLTFERAENLLTLIAPLQKFSRIESLYLAITMDIGLYYTEQVQTWTNKLLNLKCLDLKIRSCTGLHMFAPIADQIQKLYVKIDEKANCLDRLASYDWSLYIPYYKNLDTLEINDLSYETDVLRDLTLLKNISITWKSGDLSMFVETVRLLPDIQTFKFRYPKSVEKGGNILKLIQALKMKPNFRKLCLDIKHICSMSISDIKVLFLKIFSPQNHAHTIALSIGETQCSVLKSIISSQITRMLNLRMLILDIPSTSHTLNFQKCLLHLRNDIIFRQTYNRN
jgi:hypothetical protein